MTFEYHTISGLGGCRHGQMSFEIRDTVGYQSRAH